MIGKLKPRSEFSRNVLTLITGTTIAQLISIGISPILTRLYSPENFGIFALYLSIATLISTIATGRYELAIMLPKKNEYAINLVMLSIIVSFVVSLLSLLIIFIFNPIIIDLLKHPELADWIYLVPLTVFLTGLYQSFNYWNNRRKHYKQLAINNVIQSSTAAGTNIGMGLTGFEHAGLIVGQIVGQSLATYRLGKVIWHQDQTEIQKIKKITILALMKKYINFPKKSSIGAFFNVLSYQVEILLLSIYFSAHYLGLFYFVNKFVNLPKQFLSGSIWQVFLTNSGKSKDVIFNAMVYKQKKIIKYTTFPVIFGLFIYPDAFVFIFGNDWKEALPFIPPLILAMHINFIVASFSLFTLLNRPDAEMVFNLMLATLKVLAIIISFSIWGNIIYTVYAFSITQFLMFFLLGSWNYKQLEQSIFFFIKLYGVYFIASLLLLFIADALFSNENIFLKLLIYGIINVIYFGAIKNARV